MRILKNCIQCRKCGDTIESKSVHDFVTCSCGACSVDGGLDYLRRGADITLAGAMAQEESRNMSENMQWGIA